MNRPLRVLGVSGSLREGSYNTAALRAAQAVAPAGMQIEIAALGDIPLYNADTETGDGFPPAVDRLREQAASSDALLFASPEYNYSVSGVLKNAVDWLSRPPDSPLNHKPTAILGAGGRFGTLRSQLHLREILRHNDARVVGKPEVLIDRASTKFDDGLRLTDERAADQIQRLLVELAALVDGQP